MSAEIITMLGGFATLHASGGTFAMFMFRLCLRLESRVDRLEGKVDDLTRDVSDLRAESTGASPRSRRSDRRDEPPPAILQPIPFVISTEAPKARNGEVPLPRA